MIPNASSSRVTEGGPALLVAAGTVADTHWRGDDMLDVTRTGRGGTVWERFWAKVEKTDDCWLWTGARRRAYGNFRADRRSYYPHRVAYEWLVGPIPDELTIDHLCGVRLCVNPSHMEPCTRGENARRAERGNAKKTHCQRGHPYTAANTLVRKNGHRVCRACGRVRDGIRRQAARDAA